MRVRRMGLGVAMAWALARAEAAGAVAVIDVIHVPGDAASLQAAIALVDADGDVIELAAGSYPSPAAATDGLPGFRIHDVGLGFTIRAAPGATVVLDGEDARPVLRFQNSSRAAGGHVTFEGLVFRNGRSDTLGLTPGVTVQRAEATFRGCRFEDNANDEPTTGGGGVQVAIGSSASFEDSIWSGNTARYYGGGLTVSGRSQVAVRRSQFLGNRVNLPGHHPSATGGGMHVVDSTVTVERTRFADNQASYGGGGLYALGSWDDPEGGVALTVANSTFVGNRAQPDPSVSLGVPSEGGGIHVENEVALRVRDSRFVENEAHDGAGLNGYRADVEVVDSVFRGNRSTGGAGDGTKSLGGQLSMISNDVADASTENGAINRRPARLLLEDSFVEGRHGATDSPADVGGCLYLNGDANRVFGQNGVAAAGTLDENRVHATLRRVILHDCDVVQNAVPGSGVGGAIYGDVVDLEMSDTLVLGSDAIGTPGADNGSGGGVALASYSRLAARAVTWDSNSASRFGGALFAQGAELDVADSGFLGNEVSPDLAEPCSQSAGAALFVTPATGGGRPARDATGAVAASLFADNDGLPIFDDDRDAGPINDTRYEDNAFHAPSFTGAVFTNSVPNFVPPYSFCLTAAQLDALVVQRGNATTTDKGAGNADLGAAPARAALVVAPSHVLAEHAAGDDPPDGTVLAGFSWVGAQGRLDGVPLASRVGLLPVGPGHHELAADGAAQAQVTVPEPGPTAAALAALGALAVRRRARHAARRAPGLPRSRHPAPAPPEDDR